MAIWVPGPWGLMNGQPAKPQPETPHEAAIANRDEETIQKRRAAKKAEG